MEAEILYTSLSFIFACILITLNLWKRRESGRNFPPSPSGSLPFIGHIHILKGHLIHRKLYEISQKHGPIVSLWFGPKPVVVVSSSFLVQECFTKNDIVLANRPRFSVDRRSLGFSTTNVIGAPYGDHWRNLRRLCDQEIFAPTRLASFLSIRRDEILRMVTSLYKISSSSKNCQGFAKVNLEETIVNLTFNNIMRMVAGKRYYGDEADDEEEAENFRKLTKEGLELINASDPQEIFPMLRWIGCNRLEKKLKEHACETDKLMQGLIDEHRRGKPQNTMVDHLLSLQESQPEYYTDELIIELILAIIIAGIDASAVTSEWVMSLLLNHPHIIKKVRQELDDQVGCDRVVEEQDLPKLRYLRCVILETLRLFPSVPMLVPHEPSEDCEIGGYKIRRGTMVLINAWGIHRDPNVWDEPLSFKPERFQTISEVETHKLLPFGMGRRACPGAILAQRLVGLAVGSMVQCFEWERIGPEEIDLSEGPGITLVKIKTLEAMCKPRDDMDNVLQELVLLINSNVV